MKLIKAINKWRKGYPLSSSEQGRIDDLVVNLKVTGITLAVGITILWLVNTSGCFSARVTARDFIEERSVD